MATLSYAVEFIVCTAADYHCLTCHTGDLKRQHFSLCCILLATMLESLWHAGKTGLYAWSPMLWRTQGKQYSTWEERRKGLFIFSLHNNHFYTDYFHLKFWMWLYVTHKLLLYFSRNSYFIIQIIIIESLLMHCSLEILFSLQHFHSIKFCALKQSGEILSYEMIRCLKNQKPLFARSVPCL